MADLERDLRALGPELEWPPAPDAAGRLAVRRRRRGRRPLVLALGAALLAVAIAFAVPPARSAILRFFGIGGVTIERVSTAAQERPLAFGLGARISPAAAELVLGAPFRPASHGPLYQQGEIVSTLLAGPEPVLLSEFGSAAIMKKLVSGSTRFESVEIAPRIQGVWLSGGPHVVFFFPEASPRLAGNTLIWTTAGITFRLEGRSLDEARALRLARQVVGTASG